MTFRRAILPLVVPGLLAAGFVAGPARGVEEKGPVKTDFDDLFGDAPKSGKDSSLDAMKKATATMSGKETPELLLPKVNTVDNSAEVLLLNVFAARKIVTDKRRGCQPGGRDKNRIADWTFGDLPAQGEPFEVCLTLTSKAGRDMNMSVAIVDGRNQRVAKGYDVVSFRGRSGKKIDHVLEYPAPMFKNAGPYFYVVSFEGKEVGRLPLFTVKVRTTDTLTVPPTTATAPSPTAAKAAAAEAPQASATPSPRWEDTSEDPLKASLGEEP